MSRNGPTVYVIDDDDAVRQSLEWLISSIDMKVVSFPSATAFLDAYIPDQLGCLVTDVRMPGFSGLDLQDELSRRGFDIPVIIITGHGDVQTAVRAMKAGAYDFVEKPFNDQVLLDLVNRAVGDHIKASQQRAEKEVVQARLDSLTPRELQVLEFISTGNSNKKIAHTLDISEKTVEAHRAKVMEKMHTKSLAELVKMVMSLKD